MKVVHLARKPFKGTVALNVLTHGAGGLNINASRIRDGSETNEAPPEYIPNYENEVFGSGMGGGAWANTSGRWPANLIFQHLEGCVCKGTKKVKGIAGGSHSGVEHTHAVGAKLKRHGITRHNDSDGNETVANWVCVEGCPIPVLDNQSGIVPTGSWNRQKDGAHPFGNAAGSEYNNWKVVDEPEGGASRFFKAVK